MFSSSTNVVTPHSTPKVRDLEWRCRQKNCHPKTKTGPSLKQKTPTFRSQSLLVIFWISPTEKPRPICAEPWSNDLECNVSGGRFFLRDVSTPKVRCQSMSVEVHVLFFLLVFFAWFEIIKSKCLEIRCHNCCRASLSNKEGEI